jgi:chromosome segregation ATPase
MVGDYRQKCESVWNVLTKIDYYDDELPRISGLGDEILNQLTEAVRSRAQITRTAIQQLLNRTMLTYQQPVPTDSDTSKKTEPNRETIVVEATEWLQLRTSLKETHALRQEIGRLLKENALLQQTLEFTKRQLQRTENAEQHLILQFNALQEQLSKSESSSGTTSSTDPTLTSTLTPSSSIATVSSTATATTTTTTTTPFSSTSSSSSLEQNLQQRVSLSLFLPFTHS